MSTQSKKAEWDISRVEVKRYYSMGQIESVLSLWDIMAGMDNSGLMRCVCGQAGLGNDFEDAMWLFFDQADIEVDGRSLTWKGKDCGWVVDRSGWT